jgi:hypothetical protein
MELFMELKHKKNGFTGEVEPYQTGPESHITETQVPHFHPHKDQSGDAASRVPDRDRR